jgi:hypothetical protein
VLTWDKSASMGEEAVLADSGRAGEIIAEVGRVRMSRAVKDGLAVPLRKKWKIQNTLPRPQGSSRRRTWGSI